MANSKGRFSPIVRQCFVTAAICVNILGHGCVIGFPAVLLPQLEKPGAAIHLDKDANSWIASMMMIPVLFGNFFMPSIMGRLGRKTANISVILPAIAGWLVTVVADSFLMLMLGRILLGLSFGLNLPLRSVIIGEYTSPKYRGAFLMIVSLAQSSGIFIVHLLGSFISWQKTALACISFHFASLILTLYSPESPSYLAMKGRIDECREVFRWLRGEREEEELEEMLEARSFKEKKSGFRDYLAMFKNKAFYKPVIIMINANALMQFAGGITFAAYSTLIITLIAGPAANAAFWMIFLDAQRIISNGLAVYVINRYKRRTMLNLTGGLCVISHLAIAAYAYARNQGFLSYDGLWIPILLINLQIFTVATGMTPLPNVIAGEIFPFEYRGLGGSISITSVSFFSFIILKTFTGMATSIGIEGLYTVYAVAMTVFLVIIWFLLPETKGKTLQQIEDEFRGKPFKVDDAEVSLQEDTARTIKNRKLSIISNMSLTVEM